MRCLIYRWKKPAKTSRRTARCAIPAPNGAGVWTRDVSYSIPLAFAYHEPEVGKISLRKRYGRIIQDTGSGGAWPVSSGTARPGAGGFGKSTKAPATRPGWMRFIRLSKHAGGRL
ncbi:MAG: hypothetical protein R3B47_05285 [Bacteroidia bacterium]